MANGDTGAAPQGGEGTPGAGTPAPGTTLGGGGEPSFRDSLPEDLRDHASLKDFNDVGSLAKSFVHAQSMIGSDKITLPTDKSTPEQWSQFYKELGRPDNADGYDVAFKGEKWQGDPESTKQFLQACHDVGITKSQAKSLSENIVKMNDRDVTNLEASMKVDQEEVMTALRNEFGGALDDNVAIAQKAMMHFGGQALKDALNETGLGDNPVLIRAFINIGKAMSEDTLSPGIPRQSGSLTPDDAKARLAEIRKSDAFTQQAHPDHRSAVEEMQKITELAHPEEAAMVAVSRTPGGPVS